MIPHSLSPGKAVMTVWHGRLAISHASDALCNKALSLRVREPRLCVAKPVTSRGSLLAPCSVAPHVRQSDCRRALHIQCTDNTLTHFTYNSPTIHHIRRLL